MQNFDTTIRLASMRRDELIRTADRTRTAGTTTLRRIARRARRSLPERMS